MNGGCHAVFSVPIPAPYRDAAEGARTAGERWSVNVNFPAARVRCTSPRPGARGACDIVAPVSRSSHAPRITYTAVPDWSRWELPEIPPMPRGAWHNVVQRSMASTLEAEIARSGRDARVYEEVAVRWMQERPKVGVDPDVCWVEPAPPEGDRLRSLLTWREGHAVPRFALEVVSPTNPTKDYEIAPDRYADLGVEELWIFDPDLEGPRAAGGPYRLQVWRREGEDFRRVHAGDGPCRSLALGAWLVLTQERRMLRVADDPFGQRLWPTEAERERAEKERERAEKERLGAAATRVLLRGLARRLGRPLDDVEQGAVLRALEATAADVLDEELAALDDVALTAWLARR